MFFTTAVDLYGAISAAWQESTALNVLLTLSTPTTTSRDVAEPTKTSTSISKSHLNNINWPGPHKLVREPKEYYLAQHIILLHTRQQHLLGRVRGRSGGLFVLLVWMASSRAERCTHARTNQAYYHINIIYLGPNVSAWHSFKNNVPLKSTAVNIIPCRRNGRHGETVFVVVATE